MLPPSASTTSSSKSCQGSTAGYTSTLLPPNSLNKKTVVLDLDETLVHCAYFLPEDIPPCGYYDFCFRRGGNRGVRCFKKRPFVDEFLNYLHLNNFEVVIFTAALKGYASPVLDKLDPKGLISHRLYGDSCTGKNMTKDLSLLGRNLDNVVIVDDSPRSYILQPKNAIRIKPFIDDLQDDELKKLMGNFFNTCNEYKNLKDALSHYIPPIDNNMRALSLRLSFLERALKDEYEKRISKLREK